jgi:hypothetical protein
MANTSQERCPDWNLSEGTATDEFDIALASNNEFQQSIQPQVTSEILSDSFPAEDIPPQGMWASFKTGPEPGEFLKPNMLLSALEIFTDQN